MTDVGVGSDDWFDDTRTIRGAADFEFQVTILRTCWLLTCRAISKSPLRQTRSSFTVSERRHALLLRAITANLSLCPLLTGEFIRDAIKLFRPTEASCDRRQRFRAYLAANSKTETHARLSHRNFCRTLQMSHDPAWHQRLLRSRRAKQGRWL